MFLSEMWDQNFTTEYDDKLQKFMQTMFCDRAEKQPSCKQLQIIVQFKKYLHFNFVLLNGRL